MATAAVLAILTAASGCGGASEGADLDPHPEGSDGVTREFFNALTSRDYTAACELLTSESEALVLEAVPSASSCPDFYATSFTGVPVEDVEVDRLKVVEESDDEARVRVTTSYEGESQSGTIELLNEGGEWRIDIRSTVLGSLPE